MRWFLKSNGLATDTAGGGDVSILPQDNAQTLTAFKQGQIDGAWLPEPWASRLVVEGNGKILVDERDLWPQGKFVTTDLIVRTDFLQAHPKRIQALLEGLYQADRLSELEPERRAERDQRCGGRDHWQQARERQSSQPPGRT